MSTGCPGGCRLPNRNVEYDRAAAGFARNKRKSLWRSAPDPRTAGFTLIEVLVALAITSISMSLLTALAETGLSNIRHAAEYIEATRRAQSCLEPAGVTSPLVPGEQSSDDGSMFSCRVSLSAPIVHASSTTANTPRPPALYSVEATVSWRSGGAVRSVTLHTQRLGSPLDAAN